MKKVVIFGVGKSAELAKFYLENDVAYKNNYQVVGFCINRNYRVNDKFLDLSLVDFEIVEEYFPATTHYMFNTLGYSQMNTLRERIYNQAKFKGYKHINYISSKATVLGKIQGDNNFIEENAIIQPFVTIGSNNVIRYGTAIGHHCHIGNHNYITGGACLGGGGEIKNNCFLGLNCTVFDNITIENKTLIGAGAVIKRDTKKNEVYIATSSVKIKKISLEIKI